MTGEQTSPSSSSPPSPDAAGRDPVRADAELIVFAAAVVRRRCRHGRYRGLTTATANRLVNTLTGIAAGLSPRHPDELAEAAALAHRILDDDHPDHTALWQRLTTSPAPEAVYGAPEAGDQVPDAPGEAGPESRSAAAAEPLPRARAGRMNELHDRSGEESFPASDPPSP